MPRWHNLVLRKSHSECKPGNLGKYHRACWLRPIPVQIWAVAFFTMIRTLTTEDIDSMVEVEKLSWPEPLQADRDSFVERMQRFPQGFLGCYIKGELAGMSYAHRISQIGRTWEESSTSFDPQGGILYIVNVGVSTEFHRKGVGSKLLQGNKQLAQTLGLHRIVLGARDVESNIKFYTSNGFEQKERIEGYLPEDVEAKGAGVIMECIV